MFERLDVRRCGQILISDALRALREVNPDLETKAGVQAIIESMGGEEEAVDLTQLSDFIKALEEVTQRENSKKVSIKARMMKLIQNKNCEILVSCSDKLLLEKSCYCMQA